MPGMEVTAMRHDRTGELVEDEDTPVVAQSHRCRGGWIDRDADNPVPCLQCRPWLARTNIEERTP